MPLTFLEDLAIALGAAAFTAVIFGLLRQPPILGYLVAGMLVSPKSVFPLSADPAHINMMAELGVILVMFGIGLEFNLRRLLDMARSSALVAAMQVCFMAWIGFTAARVLGWSTTEAVFTGAMLSVSSTMIVTRTFSGRRNEAPLKDMVYGVLVAQDLAAILILTLLSTGTGGARVAGEGFGAAGRLTAFLTVIVIPGQLLFPPLFRFLGRRMGAEPLLVAGVGTAFSLALASHAVGYPTALGAFLAGSLVAESGVGEKLKSMIRPMRDVFASLFFVAMGMMVDPGAIYGHLDAVLLLSLLVVVGLATVLSVAGVLTGHDLRTSLRAGMILAPVGEFSFLIAGLGVQDGATRDFLLAVAMGVSTITIFLSPWLVRFSAPFSRIVERRIPRPLQTYLTLYGSWLESLRRHSGLDPRKRRMRRAAQFIVLDAGLLSALVIGAALFMEGLAETVGGWVGIPKGWDRLLVSGLAVLVSAPLFVGLVRNARVIGAMLGEIVVPGPAPGRADLGASPRAALRTGLQLAVVGLAGAPVVVLTMPFLPTGLGAGLFLLLAGAAGTVLWRRSVDLDQHVRAGSLILVQSLDEKTRTPEKAMDLVRPFLPGMEGMETVQLAADSPAAGLRLCELDLHGRSGVSVLALRRGGEGIVAPDGECLLAAGDLLVLAGSSEALRQARVLLLGEVAERRRG